MSTKESVLSCWAACKHVTIDDANALLCIVAVAKQSRELLAYQHINMCRVLNLATTQSYGTAQVNLTCIEQAANEQHYRWIADGPNHLTLVNWVDVVNLNTNVTCWALTIKHGNLGILNVLKL